MGVKSSSSPTNTAKPGIESDPETQVETYSVDAGN